MHTQINSTSRAVFVYCTAMLNQEYFVRCGSRDTDTHTSTVYYIPGGGLVLESTDRITGKVTPIACVQMQSPDCATVVVSKSDETADFVGRHDAFALFADDRAHVKAVLTNLTGESLLKIDLLAENAPRDVTDYHDEHGNSTGVGINRVNELRAYHSYAVTTDQRMQDAQGRQARIRVEAARTLATSDGTATLSQEARLPVPSGASSEMFVTVTPSAGRQVAKWMDPEENVLTWRVTDFIVLEKESVVYRGTRCVPETSHTVIHDGDSDEYAYGLFHDDDFAYSPLFGNGRSGHDSESDKDFGSGGFFDDDDRDGDSDERTYSVFRGGHFNLQSGVIEECDMIDESARPCATSLSIPKGMVSQALVSNLTTDMSNAVRVNSYVTGAKYDHSRRTPALAVRLAVASPSMRVLPAASRTVRDITETLSHELGVQLTADALVETIVQEQRIAQERARQQLETAIRSGTQKVYAASECVVCLDGECDTVLLRCMHKSLHAGCFEAMSKASSTVRCPLCRAMVQGCVVVQ